MNDLSSQPGLNLSAYQRPRVAVLVDGDNVPRSALSDIEAKAHALGETVIRRVYGDMGLHKDWAAETGYLTVHCTTNAGKNRADMHLVIGALDIAHRGLATHFLIMSDDRDFGPLVAYLREIGMKVEWAGKPKAGAAPIAAIKTATISASAPKQKANKPIASQKIGPRLAKELADGKWMTLVTLGNTMRDKKVKEWTGFAHWSTYLSKHPDLYELTDNKVRLAVKLG